MARYPHALVADLIARRHQLGWTQQALGRRINVAQGTVAQWESGRNLPPIDRLESYAAAVGLRLALVPAEQQSADELGEAS
ncbi:helix-turn-helix transcriptional regulator [Nonomuraea sp. NPDC052116]|uniref:helix-turn-helix domain-containing protein n=1 Tax=Nonomuraea sp. NPDC052116 TaxID=3155665 RepID=UPI00343BB67B